MRSLPYFDEIIRQGASAPGGEVSAAFARHVHWGFYAGTTASSPDEPDDSLDGYLAAAEAMTVEVLALSGVDDGQRILDAGCGFGGTVAHLDEHLDDCTLVGLNIDERQLVRAQDAVVPSAANHIAFVQGDATVLPFPSASFDTVLAVECAFHFPSRKQFLREVRRVLRPGGRLVVSDFLRGDGSLRDVAATLGSTEENPFYGSNSTPITPAAYRRLGSGTGLDLIADHDITAETLPTYPALRRLYGAAGLDDGVRATDQLEAVARSGLVRYHLLAFLAPGRSESTRPSVGLPITQRG